MGTKFIYTTLCGLFLAFLSCLPTTSMGQTVQTIHFESGRINWKGTSERNLQAVLRSMQRNPNQYLFIEGHTDKVGGQRYNDQLGWQRAFAVEHYFLQHGIPAHRLRICSMGEILPARKGNGPEVRRQNRRVRLQLLPMQTIAHVTARPPERSHTAPKPEVTKPKTKAKDIQPKTTTPIAKNKPNKKAAISLDSLKNKDMPYKGTRLTVQVVDAETLAPIKSVLLLKRELANSRVETDQDGVYPFSLGRGNTYDIRAIAEGYYFKEERKVVKEGDSEFMRIELRPLRPGTKIPIPDLYFDGGSAKILETSFPGLKKITEVLNHNPDLYIEIGGHINMPYAAKVPRQSEDFQLSYNRAKAVYEYLVRDGIDPKRLRYEGYGNWEMLYPKALTKEQKLQNRRVEINVLRGGIDRNESVQMTSDRPGQL